MPYLKRLIWRHINEAGVAPRNFVPKTLGLGGEIFFCFSTPSSLGGVVMVKEKEHQTDNFIFRWIKEELGQNPFGRNMCTRFPPEPNGYLHIGSAYAIHTNYSVAQKFNGTFHLRFDDTNPLKEDLEYVNAIIEDIKWLGYDPGKHIYFGSDYSHEVYNAAVKLIKKGKA